MNKVIIFTSSECTPCKQLKSFLLGKVSEDKVIYRDVEAEAEEARKYRVFSVPTTLFFKGEELVETVTGNSFNLGQNIIKWVGRVID